MPYCVPRMWIHCLALVGLFFLTEWVSATAASDQTYYGQFQYTRKQTAGLHLNVSGGFINGSFEILNPECVRPEEVRGPHFEAVTGKLTARGLYITEIQGGDEACLKKTAASRPASDGEEDSILLAGWLNHPDKGTGAGKLYFDLAHKAVGGKAVIVNKDEVLAELSRVYGPNKRTVMVLATVQVTEKGFIITGFEQANLLCPHPEANFTNCKRPQKMPSRK